MSTLSLQTKKLWWAGPLTVAASILGVLLVKVIAVAILPPPYPMGLGWVMPIVLTTILCTGGVVVYALLARFTKNPVRAYLIISVVFLVISFWPDVMFASARMPGANWPNALALMIMHVVAGAITIYLPIKLTAANNG